MRRLIAFPCNGDRLLGSIDAADGATGLLIVSGGNEVRSGAHRGMALLAASLAARGIPVFRYDRRGIGDSSGTNTGYTGTKDDLIAAVAAFRAHAPQVARIVGFGNCDAATTLALFGRTAGIDAIVLANPWVVQHDDTLPPAAAIRARYTQQLRDPATWWRALKGGIDIGKALRGMRKIAATPSQPQTLADDVIAAIRDWDTEAHIVLAKGDATAITFADAARHRRLGTRTTIVPTDSHSFARAGDGAALEAAIVAAL
ncbi:hydrolase 1, exosortase A system-associated [Sphingomonas bacterium]|uniref:hydrolase 1, exosortase A system-associated n=1 Tax=Sphingomonas bacterium TaxID=1895847 RepID=UPI001575A59A|nr:hydrolase 1, exosortase A system-associated [Sphingomonas bacterium]